MDLIFMKNLLFFLILFFPVFVFSQQSEVNSYLILSRGNELYKLKRFEEAKSNYIQLITKYPLSKYVPYSLYMLSSLESDQQKIIEYLMTIKEKYPDFEYWTNSIERLGDIFYVLEKYDDALIHYKMINTDSSIYMRALILALKKEYEKALEETIKLLSQTVDNRIVYKTLLLQIKIYFDTKRYKEIYPLLQNALKLKNYGYDGGARILFYTGKYYFIRNDIEKNYEKALYAFSLLKKLFPMSVESSMANNYLAYLKKNNIEMQYRISWIANTFGDVEKIPFEGNIKTSIEKIEAKVEEKLESAEAAIGNAIKTEVIEYIVRIGEYKDLSVANMVAVEIGKKKKEIPLGVFFRDDKYYVEVRGIKELEEAKKVAKIIRALGYDETKVIELYRLVEITD
jgi:tetratricopeptide (TPR) repeat protein